MLHMLRFHSDEWEERFIKSKPGNLELELLTKGINLSAGRQAIYHICNTLKFNENHGCLIPTFVAEGVLAPLKSLKIKCHFYKLEENLTPSISSLKEILSNNKNIKALFIIHPFGKVVNIDEESLKDINPDLEIIDDYALSLAAGLVRHKEKKDNFSLFSYNKFLPCLDGATLITPFKYAFDKPKLSACETILSLAEKHLQANKNAFNNCYTDAHIEEIASSYEDYYKVLNTSYEPRNMSPRSRHLVGRADIKNINAIRKKNVRLLYQLLNQEKFGFYYEEFNLKNGAFSVPIFPKLIDRKTVIAQGLKENILFSVLNEKWNFIPTGEEYNYRNEKNFIDNHILIPISELLSEKQMLTIIEYLNNLKG